MGLVTFRDVRRVEWQVCEVSRRQIEAHRERREAEWQQRPQRTRWSLLPGLEDGWLSFESWWEKRRLAPYPADWRELPTVTLEQLCERAIVVPEPVGRDVPGGDSARAAPRTGDPVRLATRASVVADEVPGAAALRRAVGACRFDGLTHPDVRPALRLYCAAFRTRGLDATQLIVALKALLASTPEVLALDPRSGNSLRSQLVAAGIKEYFAPTAEGA